MKILYLEESCDLTDFLVEKISKIRPKLLLRFNKNENLIGESLDINEDDDDWKIYNNYLILIPLIYLFYFNKNKCLFK